MRKDMVLSGTGAAWWERAVVGCASSPHLLDPTRLGCAVAVRGRHAKIATAANAARLTDLIAPARGAAREVDGIDPAAA
jgi:hypothetical protein